MILDTVVLVIYFLSLSFLFAFGIHGLLLIYYYRKTIGIKHPDEKMPDNKPQVTIQLPIFNEYYVTKRLIHTICQMDYPKDKMEIQILDDSTDNTYDLSKSLVEEYSQKGFDIKVLHRTDRTGYKAGALKEGMKSAKGEYIAIFDADFVPNPDFLQKTIPHFNNSNIGMVQTRWEHINEEESYLTKAQALALDGHFVLEQQVRNKSGFFMSFNGTAGVWRKSCIIDAGNWEIDTLTEDLDLSYRAQLKGWKFLFLNDVTSPAELPADINALKTQQFRWTKGAIEVAKKMLPKVFKANLPLKVKLECYTQLTSNIVFPMIVLVALLNIPIVIIKNEIGGFDQFYTFMSIFVLATASTFLFYAYAQRDIHKDDWRKRLRLFPVFLAGSMGLAVNNSRAVIEALLGIKSGFVRTPKAGDPESRKAANKKYAQKKIKLEVYIEILLTLYFIAGLGISVFYAEIAAIPFQLLFLYGFGSIGFLSLKAAFQK